VYQAFLCFITLCLCFLSACGGNSESAESSENRVLYDEAIDGPLPRGLTQLSPTDVSRITFSLQQGTSIVRGTSSVGESFLVQLDASTYIQAVRVAFINQSFNNDHVFQLLPYPYLGVGVTFVATPMDTEGSYDFSIPIQDQGTSARVFEIYTGTSVTGPPRENTYSLTFVVARR
jgi:hypothetical protein